MERGGAVRVRDAKGREISFSAWGEDSGNSSSSARGKKKGKSKGGSKAGYAPGSDVFRCKPCSKDCSGEVSFAQHCQGKAHATMAGHYGFAGLIPNSYGLIPELSPRFLQENPASNSASSAPSGKVKEPAVQKVSMSLRNEEAVRAALHRSASAGSIAKAGRALPQVDSASNLAAPSMHKCHSEGRLQPREAPDRRPQPSNLRDPTPPGLPKPPFWCAVCAQDLESEKSLAQHLAGKKHQDRERLAQKGRGRPPRGSRAPGSDMRAGSPAERVSNRLSETHLIPDVMEVRRQPKPHPDPREPPVREAAAPPPGQDGPRAPAPPPPDRSKARTYRAPVPATPPPPPMTPDAMAGQRAALPAAAYRTRILDTLAEGQVLVIEGETGCGKTTQVPQFVLEEAAQKQVPANIICTQPRRISAMGVAERIAAERGENIGHTVGYTIRLESKVSSATKLLFCTTGILLRRLEGDPDLEGVTHVFVDEVHERSIESDFLLMVLRDLLKRNKTLRLCLMSATLDVGLFARYFGGAPALSIPGRTFPVATMWLEDALQITRHEVRRGADWTRKGGDGGGKSKYRGGGGGDPGVCHDFAQGRCSRGAACRFSHGKAAPVGGAVAGFTPEFGGRPAEAPPVTGATGSYFQNNMLPGGKDSGPAASALPDPTLDDEALSEEELRARYHRYDPGVSTAISKLDPNAINYDLAVQVLQWLLQCGGPQAAADWARRHHGSSSIGEKAPEPVVQPSGAADRAWDEDSDDGGESSKVPEIPDDWESNDVEDFHVPAPPPAPVAAPEPSPAQPSLAATGPADAVLVFLPGLKEIQQMQDVLLGMPEFASEPQRSWVLPLHSTVPPEEQRLVFQRPPPGVHKIVLSTNIAETAITIDDIGFVIDTGRMKENRYDPLRRMASLEDVLVSQANARQRRGRAGRVRPGAAIHLISSHRHNCIAAAQQAPEVQRVPLEQLVLQIKALQYPGTAAEVCAQLLEPPSPEAVMHAVTELVRLEALQEVDGAEVLTPLGIHLSKLPVDVRIGKLLLLGAIFDVPDECLTIAAVLSCRSPFLSPFERRDEADAAKQQFRFGQSDHLSTLCAYNEWDSLGKGERRFGWARANFLGVKTLQMIASLKRQLLELLSEAGFVQRGLHARAVESVGRRDGSDGCRIAIMEGVGRGGGFGQCFRCNRTGHNARDCPQADDERGEEYNPAGRSFGMSDTRAAPPNVPLLQALLCAALYPQVMTVEYPKPKPGKKIKPESLKFRIREDGQSLPTEVALHPSSINSKAISFDSSYLVYHERVKTTRMYVRDCTPVSPYALMLFGGDLAAEGSAGQQPLRGGGKREAAGDSVLSVDGWIKFSVPSGTQSLLLAVRESLDILLKQKIEQPNISLGGHREVIDAVVQLICTQ